MNSSTGQHPSAMERCAKWRSLKLLELRVNIPKPVFPAYFSLKYCCYTKWQTSYWSSESQRSNRCPRLPLPRKANILPPPKINTRHHVPTQLELSANHYIIAYFARTCAHVLPGICLHPNLAALGSFLHLTLCIFCNLSNRLFCCSRWDSAKRIWLSFPWALPWCLERIAERAYW